MLPKNESQAVQSDLGHHLQPAMGLTVESLGPLLSGPVAFLMEIAAGEDVLQGVRGAKLAKLALQVGMFQPRGDSVVQSHLQPLDFC